MNNKSKKLFLIAIFLLALTACRSQPTAIPSPAAARYFAVTGQTVRGDFLRFFDT
jgi:hypothetical protein